MQPRPGRLAGDEEASQPSRSYYNGGDAMTEFSERVVWLPDAWRAPREDEHKEEASLHIIDRKLDHLLGGFASILEALASITEGQGIMEAELQPVLDAVNNLATEEGLTANAVKTIVDKVNNGQVVVKADAQALVDAINGVTDSLKTVVGTIPADNPPVTPAAPPASTDTPPVSTTVPAPADPAPASPTPADGVPPVEPPAAPPAL
jgi:hypothetical protein